MNNREASITVVRGNPTADEIAAIAAALARRSCVAPTTRAWGTPAANLGLSRPDPWGRATGWRTPTATTDLWST